ncbi:hypothetical protein D3C72_1703300 [compost metagenome]
MGEVAGLSEPPLGALLFERGRDPLSDRTLRLNQLLARLGKAKPGLAVAPERQRLPPPVEPVVVSKSHRPARRDIDV